MDCLNRRVINVVAIASLGVFGVFNGCKSSKTSPVVQVQCVLPDTVSFSKDVVPIFIMSCDQSGCHSGTDAKGRINLEPESAYSNLFNRKLVDTLNPTHSRVYTTIVAPNSTMPPGIYLDNCTVNTILKWIEQGAKNN